MRSDTSMKNRCALLRYVTIGERKILSNGDHDLSHDWTATGILTAQTDHWPLSVLDFCRVKTMAEVENAPPLEQALAKEVLAQGVAKPYPFPFCLWSPFVASLKKFQHYYHIQGP